MIRDFEMIQNVYANLRSRVATARRVFGRPLTLAEKLLAAHLAEDLSEAPKRQQSYVLLNPDRVAMQDATAQMALLQFMSANRPRVAIPSTVHCDHLIRGENGAAPDLERALQENNEVYAFLKSVSRKYGIGFWKPGSGIIHQVILEQYAFPGGLMIGTDSHTPNAGGLGMVAIGVGGADAVDAMAGIPWELQWPGAIAVKLTGKLNGWASAKDVILAVAGQLTVSGGTGCIVEYIGDGTRSLSCTGKGTITNMGAEIGATTSLFPFDERHAAYLRATERGAVADLAAALADVLAPDPEVVAHPEEFYDRVLTINLDELEPHVVGPFTPDLDRPISAFKAEAQAKGYPEELKVGLIGSCTNSSYEDIGRAAHVARQALAKGLKARSELLITPGSEQVRATIERDGLLATLTKVGGKVLANACGPCIGQWMRHDVGPQVKNSIITSFNRNFKARNDGNPATLAFIGSPELVMAMTIAGKVTFNPITDTLVNERGETVKLEPPVADELPAKGFDPGVSGYEAPADDPTSVAVAVDPASKRLQVLAPFAAWDGKDLSGLLLLVKAVGKCTTDHISPAGQWLRFRGHLDNISNNMLTGATNAFGKEPGQTSNALTGAKDRPIPEVARDYKAKGHAWIIVGDQNYGEGSSREHAAMSPRFLGCRVVLVRSFARIHETNLKKQGILPLTFADPKDYDKVREGDRISLKVGRLTPGRPVTVTLAHADGTSESFKAKHTLSKSQLSWLRAGSALNALS